MAWGLALMRRSPSGGKLPTASHGRPVLVEELLGSVAAKPCLQLGQVSGVRSDLGQGELVGAEGALDLEPVDDLRARSSPSACAGSAWATSGERRSPCNRAAV